MIVKEPLSTELYDSLACPACKADVKYNSNKTRLVCVKCKREYPIKGDVPIMMVE